MRRALTATALLALCALGSSVRAQDAGPRGAPQPPPPEIVEQLHDVRPPVDFRPWWRTVDTIAATSVALTLAGLILLAVGIARLRRRAPEDAQVDRLAAAIEEAGRRLDALASEGLFERGAPEAHQRLARELPPILKTFLAATQDAPVDCFTTRETHGLLVTRACEEAARDARQALAACDELKFAGKDVYARDPIPQARAVVSALAERLASGVREEGAA